MMHYINLLIPLVVLLPNLVYVFMKPKDESVRISFSPILTLAESIGQIGLCILPLFFVLHFNRVLGGLMALALALYYAGWLRYFLSRHTNKTLYKPLLGLPIPLAILPLLYFLAAALMFNVWPLYLCAVLFGIDHLSISYKHYLA